MEYIKLYLSLIRHNADSNKLGPIKFASTNYYVQFIKLFSLINILFVSNFCLASEPLPWQISLQPAASVLMLELVWFNNFLNVITFSIVLIVFILLTYVCIRFNAKRNPIPATFSHNVTLEIAWTIVPVILLIIIAIPSFTILKKTETLPKAELTIKVVGNQWYWHYNYPDSGNFGFDSYIIPDDKLLPGQKRLLEVDNRLVIPEDTVVRFLITSSDVLHSFAVPSFGIKMDAVPGRINETWTKVLKKGIYYGQCSELCGVNHGFMPIAVEVVSKAEFQQWLEQAKTKYTNNRNILLMVGK